MGVLLKFAPQLLDAVNEDRTTPLMFAVMFDRRDATNMLLQAGADVRAKNRNNDTVFDYARSNGHNKMLEILNQHPQVSGIF